MGFASGSSFCICKPFVYRHDSDGTQLREIFLEQMTPDFSSFLSFQFRSSSCSPFPSGFLMMAFTCRQVFVVLHLHQREEKLIILCHHIISDALGVDAVTAEQGIHGSLSAPGKSHVVGSRSFWRRRSTSEDDAPVSKCFQFGESDNC